MGLGLPLVVGLMFLMLFSVNGDDSLNSFFTDIITKFRLISPIIIYHGDIPEICMTHTWLLCLDQENDQEILLEQGKSIFTTIILPTIVKVLSHIQI